MPFATPDIENDQAKLALNAHQKRNCTVTESFWEAFKASVARPLEINILSLGIWHINM